MTKTDIIPLKLDPGTFGGTAACRVLTEKLNATGDRKFAVRVVVAFNDYFNGLNQMLKLDNPIRDRVIKSWFEEHMAYAVGTLKPQFDEREVGFSYFENVLHHRRRQAQEHGALLEKFRGEDTDHAEIILQLRALAKAQAGH